LIFLIIFFFFFIFNFLTILKTTPYNILFKKKSKNLRAIVLEMYGTGNAPSKRTGLLSAITKARANGIIVAALTQCLTGAVMLGKYAVGDALKEG
jgi:L-asparaginase/Glu-tRNA(Gln) amidotransferase subunit D